MLHCYTLQVIQVFRDVGELWNEYVTEYLSVARDYNLNNEQKLQYLHNLMSGDAKRFYLSAVEPHAITFDQAVELIDKEYNSIVHQNRVKDVLNQLRLKDKMRENNDEGEALAEAYKIITKLSPQVPTSHTGNAHKDELLRNAVVGCEWATVPLSRIATYNLSFQQLYRELESACLLNKEAKMAVLRNNIMPTRKEDRYDGSRE